MTAWHARCLSHKNNCMHFKCLCMYFILEMNILISYKTIQLPTLELTMLYYTYNKSYIKIEPFNLICIC